MSGDKIVSFKPAAKEKGLDDFPATVKKRDYQKPACVHRTALIDIEARTLECEDCHVALDALAFVNKLAHEWDQEKWHRRQDKKLDIDVGTLHKRGGRIIVRPSGVVVQRAGKSWASSVTGGMTAQLESALNRERWSFEEETRRRKLSDPLPGQDGA